MSTMQLLIKILTSNQDINIYLMSAMHLIHEDTNMYPIVYHAFLDSSYEVFCTIPLVGGIWMEQGSFMLECNPFKFV